METNRENKLPEETEAAAEEVLNQTEPETGEPGTDNPETSEPETGEPVENRPETDETGEAPEAAPETEEPAGIPEAPGTGPEPQKKRKLGGTAMKMKRGGMATLMSVVFIAIVVVLNVLVSLLTERFPSLDVDLTANKMNSLSDQALEIAKGIEQDTSIFLIGEEDSYRKDRLYSDYGLEYSQVANLAEKLQEANSKISVEFIDPDTNPGFISEYAGETLTSGTVLVRTEQRYKVLNVTDLFNVSQNSSTYQMEIYSKVDGALAGALELVNLKTVPVIAIATGHDELLASDSADSLLSFTELMESQNFEIQKINFLTDEIPEDAQVVLIPTPSTDYTEEEIDKLRAFLDNADEEQDVTVWATFHSTQADLPRLSSFLEEWGIQVEEGMVAETDVSRMLSSNPSFLLADVDQTEILKDNSYPNLVVAENRPITLLFDGNVDISTQALWTSADSSFHYTADMTEIPDDPETGSQILAALGVTNYQINGGHSRHSVVVFGSSYIFTDRFISATAYSNRNYIRDLMQFCTGTEASQVTTVSTSQVQTNVQDVAASQSTILLLGLGVFTAGLPLVILIVGLVVFLRRRHL